MFALPRDIGNGRLFDNNSKISSKTNKSADYSKVHSTRFTSIWLVLRDFSSSSSLFVMCIVAHIIPFHLHKHRLNNDFRNENIEATMCFSRSMTNKWFGRIFGLIWLGPLFFRHGCYKFLLTIQIGTIITSLIVVKSYLALESSSHLRRRLHKPITCGIFELKLSSYHHFTWSYQCRNSLLMDLLVSINKLLCNTSNTFAFFLAVFGFFLLFLSFSLFFYFFFFSFFLPFLFILLCILSHLNETT